MKTFEVIFIKDSAIKAAASVPILQKQIYTTDTDSISVNCQHGFKILTITEILPPVHDTGVKLHKVN
jgi:hypothetical protein